MILHNKLVIVIIALFVKKSLAQYPKVRCPDTFQYTRDFSGREIIGRLYLQPVEFGETRIKITLSQPDDDEYDFEALDFQGNITLLTDENDLYDFIKRGSQVAYEVLFPVSYIVPIVHSIRVNNKRICTGPKVPPGNRKFVLRHTMNIPEENMPQKTELPARHAAPVYLSAVDEEDDPNNNAYGPIPTEESAYGVRPRTTKKSAYGDRPRPTLKSAYGTRPTTTLSSNYDAENNDEYPVYGPRPTEESAYGVPPTLTEKSAYGDRPRPTLKSAYGTRPTTTLSSKYDAGNNNEYPVYGPRPTEESAYGVPPTLTEKSAYGDRPRPTLKSAYGTRPTTISATSTSITTTTSKPPHSIPPRSDLQQTGWTHIGRICGRENLNITVDRLAINGKTISQSRFPWIVAIYKNSAGKLQFQCGGSLITQRTVISAAHCFYYGYEKIKDEDILISLGRHKLTDWTASYIIQSDVAKIISHPDYDPTYVYNDADIAIVQLKKSVTFSDSIMPVCLWQGESEVSEIINVSGTVVGWGKDENNNDVSTFPKLITANIVSQLTCIKYNPDMLPLTSNRTLCAGNLDGTGPCSGDSGSGLMIQTGNKWRLRGLVSSALSDEHRTCNLKDYVVYSDIAAFTGWVFNNCVF